MSAYRFLEHTTDAEIEAYGKDLDEAFENAGRALEDTMVDINAITPKKLEEIAVQGSDLQSLLYSWLEALIIKEDVDQMLYSEFECRVSSGEVGCRLRAQVRGEVFDPSKHHQKTAIKAPTYHAMKIERDDRGVKLHFLLDL